MRLKTVTFATALFCTVAFVGPAFADPPADTGNGNGNCGVGQGNGGPTECTNNGGNGGNGGQGGNGGNGGQGGNGGHGGTGVGVGVGVGIAHQGQKQQQKQQQQQGQAQSSNNLNANVNLNDNSNSNNATQSVNTYNERAPVNTAYAAPLTTGEDTCMGSSSIGGQGVGFGLTIGTTWVDDNCQRLKNSRELGRLGYSKASVALICINEEVQIAMAAAGTPCPYKRDEEASYDREEPTRVAHNDYADSVEDVQPVAKPAPVAKPEYRFVPMQPIRD